jgi:hypothetical protein
MKLLQELLTIVSEEAIETKKASDLWKDNKDKVKTYVSSATFQARVIDGSDPKRYEVYKDANDKRKLVGKFDSDKFNKKYEPVRAKQNEDAEGYKLYREAGDVESFQYDGDTTKVDLEGQVGKLKNGDYLIRTTEGDNFIYAISSTETFEADYIEEK